MTTRDLLVIALCILAHAASARLPVGAGWMYAAIVLCVCTLVLVLVLLAKSMGG